MTDPTAARDVGACDACAGRLPVEITCSRHFIDLLFPEAEEERKPRGSTDYERQHQGERGL